jgi:hypothetical protein
MDFVHGWEDKDEPTRKCECASCNDKLEIERLKKIIDFQKYVIYDLDQRLQHLRAENFMEKNK